MTAKTQQSSLPFWVAAIGILLADGWMGWTCWSQYEQAQLSQVQLATINHLAANIESLRQSPVRVDEGVQSSDALAVIVETSAKQVGLNPQQIVRIDPGEPRRIGESPYLEQKTDVEVRDASLRQIVEFILTLEDGGNGLSVPNLSLRVPNTPDAAGNPEELWSGQLTLLSRIFERNKVNAKRPNPAP